MEKLFYFAQIFEGINVLVIIGIVFSVIVLLYCFIQYCDDEFTNKVRITCKKGWIGLIISILLVVFIPTKRTFLFMMGGRAVDSIISNNPEIKELPGNTLNLLNEYIKVETEKLNKKDEK